jgi:hypothetical protein
VLPPNAPRISCNRLARACINPTFRRPPSAGGGEWSSEALQERVGVGLRDAWGAGSREEATGRFAHLIAELRLDAPRLAEWLADTAAETLACYVLAREDVRRKLRSTNGVERHHQEIRRRTRVIRIFPHEASLHRLLTALAIEQNDNWRHVSWLVDPVLVTPEAPMRRTA